MADEGLGERGWSGAMSKRSRREEGREDYWTRGEGRGKKMFGDGRQPCRKRNLVSPGFGNGAKVRRKECLAVLRNLLYHA